MQTLKEVRVEIEGIRPLIMHNGLLADPTHEVVRAMKRITAKKNKKTDADNEELARLEWLGGWYLNADGRPYIPAANIERMVLDGARKLRLGKDCQAAVFCEDDQVALQHDELDGKKVEKLAGDPRFAIRCGVVVTQKRIIRVRPMVPTGWRLVFRLNYDSGVINLSSIRQAITDAGMLCGLGDWRPKFGRFTAKFSE
jgi:hypothetical protein